MKKFISTCLLIYICSFTLQAQTAVEVFNQIPAEIPLTLTSENRLDLVDLYNAKREAIVKNPLGDSCTLVKLTNDYLQLQWDNNTLDFIMLPMINDSKLICLIHTTCAPICDSRIEFYSTNWKKLDSEALITLVDKSWFIKEGTDINDQRVHNALIPLDIDLMQFQYDPENLELSQHYNTPEYISVEEKKTVEVFLKTEPKKFKWNKTRFN